ncbi:MAG: sensor histidine kinase [Lachnospiraceae bacterium]|nr:sensor histidine kinase [Lachnospiraceae bacterium]
MKRVITSSFKREMLISLLVVSLLPLVVSSLFLIGSIKAKISGDYEKEARAQLLELADGFSELIRSLEEADAKICENSELSLLLESSDLDDQREVYQTLYAETSQLRSRAGFSIYSTEGKRLFSTNGSSSAQALPVYFGILKRSLENPDSTIYDGSDYSETGSCAVRSCRVIKESGKVRGFFVTEISENEMKKLVEGKLQNRSVCMILDEFWHEIYSNEETAGLRSSEILRSAMLEGLQPSQVEKDSNFYATAVEGTGFSIVIKQHEIFSESITESMNVVMLTVAGISLVLCIIVAVVLSRQLTKPLDSFKKAIGQLEKGNLDVSVEVSRHDEFQALSDSFNSMTGKLKGYMDYEVRKQHELDEANIAMLQAQLNPHFLYNTLDTMKWVAKANGLTQIATMSQNLAKILRSSISPEKFVTLEDELKLCRSYIDIQTVRFEGKFSFETDVPDDLLDLMVPKLILQPIVENSIIHGLEDAETGHIKITARKEGEDLLKVMVTDDGCGISGEVLDHLNSHDRRQLVGHIGFFNVDTIIRMHYGEPYGMKAENIEGGGACVTIELPVVKSDR